MARSGPMITASCHGCEHERSERYQVQGDSGSDVSCIHPAIGSREVGDTRWDTPAWCPSLAESAERFLVAIRAHRSTP